MNTEQRPAFKCPVCGGPFFGTRGNLIGPAENVTRYCKGSVLPGKDGRPGYKTGYSGCSFTWPASDDAKYGLEVWA